MATKQTVTTTITGGLTPVQSPTTPSVWNIINDVGAPLVTFVLTPEDARAFAVAFAADIRQPEASDRLVDDANALAQITRNTADAEKHFQAGRARLSQLLQGGADS